MKNIFISLGIMLFLTLNGQAQNVKSLQEKKAAIEAAENTKEIAYVDVLIALSHAYLKEKKAEESRENLMEAGGLIKLFQQELKNATDLDSAERALKLCNSDYVLVWFKQLALENKPKIAQDYLKQQDWFASTIALEKHNSIVQLLEIAEQYYGSQSDAYLKNWMAAYKLYTTYGTRNREKAEQLWLNLLDIRAEKFGKTSDEYVTILFGLSNFYDRTKRTEDFEKLKTEVEKHWPSAYEFQNIAILQNPEEEIDEEPIEEPDTDESSIYSIVETMPRFPGCEEEEGDHLAKKSCADQKLLQFIYENIKYPELARENGIEGMSVVSFVVSEHGTIVDAKILRNPGGATGEESLRLVLRMNEMPERWTPGTQTDKVVRVIYNLPVRYKLN